MRVIVGNDYLDFVLIVDGSWRDSNLPVLRLFTFSGGLDARFQTKGSIGVVG